MRVSRLRQQLFLNVPRVSLPLLEGFEALFTERTRVAMSRGRQIKCGAMVELTLCKPAHYMMLAHVLVGPKVKRFGCLFAGQAWGFLAGIVSPKLRQEDNIGDALARLFFLRKGFHNALTLKLLLVDTFTLDGTPRREPMSGSLLRRLGGLMGNEVDVTIGRLVTGDAKRGVEEAADAEVDA